VGHGLIFDCPRFSAAHNSNQLGILGISSV
jgi:hypothetical protein